MWVISDIFISHSPFLEDKEIHRLPVQANTFDIERVLKVQLLKQDKSMRGDFSTLKKYMMIGNDSEGPLSNIYFNIFVFSSFLHFIFLVWFFRWRMALLCGWQREADLLYRVEHSYWSRLVDTVLYSDTQLKASEMPPIMAFCAFQCVVMT